MSATTSPSSREHSPDLLEQRIMIEPDGAIVVRSGKVDYGQGIRTGFARMVAHELAVPLERVRVELGETDHVPWDMGTFGSMSIAVDGRVVRAAAACARKILLERAAARLGIPALGLSVANGEVLARDGRSITYQELVRDEPLSGIIPESEVSNSGTALAEDIPLRLEALSIVTGTIHYSSDVRLPGMLWGQAVHPPFQGGEIAAVDDSDARAVPGVIAVVREHDFAGVVATRSEQAMAAIRALRVEWKRTPVAPEPPIEAALRRAPDIDAAFAAASRRFSAEYHVPHISHVPIGPSVAVADVGEEEAHLYVTTQRPFGLRDQVAELLGLSSQRIHIHPQAMSGTYGRGNMNDAPIDAVRLSRAVKHPVLVQWSREEEFRSSPHRPVLDAQITAALDPEGTIVAWRYLTQTNRHTAAKPASLSVDVLEATSGRNAVPPYRLASLEVVLRVAPGRIRTGAFRSLAGAPNVFAIESFMDELACRSEQDPVAFRLRHIEDERLRRVLSTVRERSGYGLRPRQEGRGFGIACTIYHGTYIAQVVELEVNRTGQARIEQVWCAIDAGRLVHPDGARNQIEGGIQQAASWTLFEELQINEDQVLNKSLRDYRIASFREAIRKMDITFLPAQEFPSTGIGEAGTVPLPAAVANAVFDACGVRVRKLPLTPAAIAAARMATTEIFPPLLTHRR